MRFSFLTIALIATSCTLLAQPQERLPGRPPWASHDYLTAAVLVSPDISTAQVEILFRCSATSLVALRSADPLTPYLRKGELTIELLDSSGTSRAREIDRIEASAQGPDTSDFPLSWIERRYSFHTPPGRYQIHAELQDLQSKNRIQRNAPLLAPPVTGDSLRVVPLFFTLGSAGTVADTLRPQNFGDGILFASPGALLLHCSNVDSGVQSADATIRFLVQEGREIAHSPLREEKRSGLPLQFGRSLDPSGSISYALQPSSGAGKGAFLILPLPLEQLPLRHYRIEIAVTAGTRHATAAVDARMLWPDQPESLRDVEYAIESLRFITSGRTVDSLLSGGFEARRDKLEAFWKERDATAATARNPLMTEYYRRVDHARVQLASLKQMDGTRTDRGKIYILYGPPSNTERTLDPVHGFTETWTYERTGRKFVFLDKNKDGIYTLLTAGSR